MPPWIVATLKLQAIEFLDEVVEGVLELREYDQPLIRTGPRGRVFELRHYRLSHPSANGFSRPERRSGALSRRASTTMFATNERLSELPPTVARISVAKTPDSAGPIALSSREPSATQREQRGRIWPGDAKRGMAPINSPSSSSVRARVDGTPVLDVFSLRDSVVDEYKRFATSFTTIHAQDIREQVEVIYGEQRYWPEPLIQINPSYKRSTDVGTLAESGVVDPGSVDIFRADGRPLSLYKHQEQAIALAADGESFVVTTGTGSGKLLCFFIPIVSHVLRARRTSAQPRTHAVVVYPMNALANSQMEELDKFIGQVPGDQPITFARYTGQE